MKKMKKYGMGAELKDIPSDNKGLGKLPTEVRNKMGYKKMGGEKLLNKMTMGGAMDMSEEFVTKMRNGGDTMRATYKYGGAMKKQKYKMGGYVSEPKKMQMGGSSQSRVNGYKK
jgi:hypothetical protein